MTARAIRSLVFAAAVPAALAPAAVSVARRRDADKGVGVRAAAAGERRVALVIGNGGYRTGPLRNPGNDARAMARALGDLGFSVDAHTDLGQKAMKRAILDFGGALRGGGVGLFYYSGHGMQVGGRNYLIPVDARIESEADVEIESVDVGAVLAKMDGAGNRLNLVILDACRDNPFARAFRSSARGLAFSRAPSGTLIAYATAPDDVAADGEGTLGAYTGALLSFLPTAGLRVEDVFKRTRERVEQETGGRQVPWESSSLKGDFYFAGIAPAPAPAAPAPPAPAAVLTPRPGPAAAPARPAKGMVYVPPGEFFMGCNQGVERSCDADQKPGRTVRLSRGFFLDRTEVTVDAYDACVRAGACAAPDTGGHCNWRTHRGDHPVNCVSWKHARDFCVWAGKRLPTEAEWERAARGTDGRLYPWGNQAPDCSRAVYASCFGADGTEPVGRAAGGAAPSGALDLAGNVWEWVQDCYDSGWYGRAPAVDPLAESASCSSRVLRGGSFYGYAVHLRASGRGGGVADSRSDRDGFRCARTASE